MLQLFNGAIKHLLIKKKAKKKTYNFECETEVCNNKANSIRNEKGFIRLVSSGESQRFVMKCIENLSS